ncbi:MAG: YraN family protein, partial [SAR202 cluster bacterium]|nr:YraN family protein [SAR202 cluster bacterium]
RGTRVGSPEEFITPRKRSKMTATAQEYLQVHESEERGWRIDVVVVEIGHDGRLRRIDIVENAVEG